jgi:hypothetical protein
VAEKAMREGKAGERREEREEGARREKREARENPPSRSRGHRASHDRESS